MTEIEIYNDHCVIASESREETLIKFKSPGASPITVEWLTFLGVLFPRFFPEYFQTGIKNTGKKYST